MKKTKKRVLIVIIGLFSLFILFSVAALFLINNSYNEVFSRCMMEEYNSSQNFVYNDLDSLKYKREKLPIMSGENMLLDAYLYNAEGTKGLVVISMGHRMYSALELPGIMHRVDQGWSVICYDYTGCYGSAGDDMVGYMQAPADLDAVLTYVENDSRFVGMPVVLYGHSLGAYASLTVLQYGHSVNAVVAASSFDDPMEQWMYSVYSHTGVLGGILAPYAELLMWIKFGEKSHFSAIDGINSVSIPIMVITGSTDEFYGNVSSVYVHKAKIRNPNCIIKVMDDEKRHGHYNYLLTERALEYQQKVYNKEVLPPIDKALFSEADTALRMCIDQFCMQAIQK